MNSILLKLRDGATSGRIEPLEQRIAPALAITNTVTAVVGSALEMHAGDVLSTATAGGSYLLFVEKGNAVVYTTDLNGNAQIDFNEITGISAGDGLRLISFVDIHGDIVTNLRPDGKRLTDSDNNATNGFDGRVVLNSQIEKIELRSLTQADLPVGVDVLARLALSTYSLFGNIYAGKGFGATDGGLIIDTVGVALQGTKFTGNSGISQFVADVPPSIGSIRAGTAVSDHFFSFGASPAGRGLGFNGEDVAGQLQSFRQPANQDGADITGLRIADGITKFNLGTLQAGDGGFNGRGGNVTDVSITGDAAGGYALIAGNAGESDIGKAGGSILNFRDAGSITSQILLQSGNGGRGLLGAGGPGGNIDLTGVVATDVPVNAAGRLIVNLGDGGDGLTAGGNGGSQKTGTLTTPETSVPLGLSVASSTHKIGDIFNTISDVPIDPVDPNDPNDPSREYHAMRGFDFDLDGVNDVVYTTKGPDQLVVLFGHPLGGFDPQGVRAPNAPGSIYLNGPSNAEAVTVADVNGDGFPDIIAASLDPSLGGVYTFISRYNIDPITSSASFIGFTDAIISPLPSLTLLSNYYQKAVRVHSLAAGDFDGDGVMDVALTTVQTRIIDRVDVDVLLFMRGDSVDDANDTTPPIGTGQFFADFVNGVDPLGGPPAFPFSFAWRPSGNYADRTVMHATALADGGQDYLLISGIDSDSLYLYDYTAIIPTPIRLRLGQVDSNRDVSDPNKRDNIDLVDAKAKDYTVGDFDDDRDADIAVLTENPQGFLVVFQGDGTPAGFVIASNDPIDDDTGRDGENSGIRLSEDPPKGLGLADTLVGILTTASQPPPVPPATGPDPLQARGNDITIVDYNSDSGLNNGFIELSFRTTAPGILFDVVVSDRDGIDSPTGGLDQSILAFDTYRPLASDPLVVGYAAIVPRNGDRLWDYVETSFGASPLLPLGGFVSLANNGFFFTAGDGGDAATGKGGLGGQLGDKLINSIGQATGTLSVTLPAADAFEPTVRFLAGHGGNGYTAGGAGGASRGISVIDNDATFNVESLLFGGDGGDSVKGAGGRGGDLDALSIIGGTTFLAGAGGKGVTGGDGGSVVGNKLLNVPDTSNAETTFLVAKGGDGGLGLKHGGNGGSILNFTPDFRPFLGGESEGVLAYQGGAGGNSLSGAGGNGGSVTNSSPLATSNFLVADVALIGGVGGDGRTGGAGGDVTKFFNAPTQGSLPLSVSVLAGYGGAGTLGKGGAGGNIREVNITARGIGFGWSFDFSNPSQIEFFPGFPSFPINFGRYIAGEGGVSYGGIGGNGGSISSVSGVAVSASFAVAGGRGGDGLRGGADGGSIAGGATAPSTINAAANIGKVLVIAGDGGDVFGALASPQDPLAYGGIDGKGGNGGNITDVAQSGSQTTTVDLIAGNGGNTPNFGSPLDRTTNTGRGGSIRNVQVAGDIGNVTNDNPATTGEDENETVPIKAYNDIFIGERVSDFVLNILVNGAFNLLDDALGNVGLVAGATGRVKDNNNDGVLDPASVGVNGSVVNVSAANIMSAVAGSVDRIASIQIIDRLTVPSEGSIYGADKAAPDPATLGTRDYLDEGGNLVSTPVLGGELLDGAVVGKNDFGKTVLPNGVIVVRPQNGVRDFVRA